MLRLTLKRLKRTMSCWKNVMLASAMVLGYLRCADVVGSEFEAEI